MKTTIHFHKNAGVKALGIGCCSMRSFGSGEMHMNHQFFGYAAMVSKL